MEQHSAAPSFADGAHLDHVLSRQPVKPIDTHNSK